MADSVVLVVSDSAMSVGTHANVHIKSNES